MALVKFGGGVTQLSGSIAGNTFARNRFGNYIRARTKPVNPNSDRQNITRTQVRQLASYWSGVEMSDAERGAWATYAAAIAMKNRLGEVAYLTGFNHFIRSNAARMLLGGAIIEPGPTTLTLPGGDTALAVAANSDSQLLTVTFDDAQDWCSETGGFLSIAQGLPQIITRNFFGGPFRNAGGIAGNTGVPITSPQTLTAPFTLVAGQKVWTFARIVRADGRVSDSFFAPALLVSAAASVYNVAGATSPAADGDYTYEGTLNGKPYFASDVPGFYIWWNGVDSWIISILLGTPAADHFKRTNTSVVGPYTNQGAATGTVIVGAGAGA